MCIWSTGYCVKFRSPNAKQPVADLFYFLSARHQNKLIMSNLEDAGKFERR